MNVNDYYELTMQLSRYSEIKDFDINKLLLCFTMILDKDDLI